MDAGKPASRHHFPSTAFHVRQYKGPGDRRHHEPTTTVELNQLIGQLQGLQAAVARTLPVLTAFNSKQSQGTNGQPGIAGRMASILAGVLGRNASTNGPSSSGNATGILGGILSTNSGPAGTVSLDPNTLNELKTLQENLQAVAPALRNLVGTSSSGESSAPGTPQGNTGRGVWPHAQQSTGSPSNQTVAPFPSTTGEP